MPDDDPTAAPPGPPGSVWVNDATPWQIAALLSLSRDETETVLAARPFASVLDLRRALPARAARTPTSLFLPKLNVNRLDVDTLNRILGFPSSDAQRIVAGRPYHFMRQLRSVVGADLYAKLVPVATTPRLTYVDKLTGRTRALRPNESRVLVSRSESEGIDPLIDQLKLRRVFPHHTRSPYEVLDIPESESAGDTLGQLQRRYGRNVLPAYRDESESDRFLNPRFCVVQFRAHVPAGVAEALLTSLGLLVETRHRTPGLYTVRIPSSALDPGSLTVALTGLNADEDVLFAEPNYFGFDDRDHGPASPTTGSAPGSPWNLALSRVPQAWTAGRGSADVVVAVLDTGIDAAHPAFHDKIVARRADETWDFTASGAAAPVDEDGHGTFVAGLVVGDGGGVTGVAPGCRVLPLKIPLLGEPDAYQARRDAILYAVDRVRPPQRLVLNLSWKTTGDVGLIREALSQASAAGAVLVASAGNDPESGNEPHYPSDYPEVMSVAAVGPESRRASYSFWGDRVDLSAPGGEPGDAEHGIVSAKPGGGTSIDYGTSFAAPHVAAGAALVLSCPARPDAAETRASLEIAARTLDEPGMGRGLCDVSAAIARHRAQRDGATAPASPLTALDRINSLGAEDLVAAFGLLPFTARLIVARRPVRELSEIRDLLGMSTEQYARILSAPGGPG